MIDKAYLAINELILKKEKANHHEVLRKILESKGISNKNWSLIQLHILNLIDKKKNVNNTYISKQFNISKPAVTKAIKVLLGRNMISEVKKNKFKYYVLTCDGEHLASVYSDLHEQVKEKYYDLLKNFDDKELNTIIKFLNTWESYI